MLKRKAEVEKNLEIERIKKEEEKKRKEEIKRKLLEQKEKNKEIQEKIYMTGFDKYRWRSMKEDVKNCI